MTKRKGTKGMHCTRKKLVTIKHGKGRGKRVKRCAKFAKR